MFPTIRLIVSRGVAKGGSMLTRKHNRCCRRVRSRHDRGAVAVEFALVLPLLVMLLLGVTTAGLAFNQAIALSNGVREGSRFGASTIADTGASGITAAEWQTWADQVIARSRESMTDSSSGQVSVCVMIWKNTTTPPADAVPGTLADFPNPRCGVGSQGLAGGAAPTPPAVAAGTCVVAVWGVNKLKINALLLVMDPTIRRESIARYERAC